MGGADNGSSDTEEDKDEGGNDDKEGEGCGDDEEGDENKNSRDGEGGGVAEGTVLEAICHSMR